MNLPAEYQLGPRAVDLLTRTPPLPERSRSSRPPRFIIVPRDLAVVYDGRRWSLEEPPPAWWLDALDPACGADDEWSAPVVQPEVETLQPPVVPAVAVPIHEGVEHAEDRTAEAGRRTACRPGRGPCRRRHEHASGRRAA